MVDPIRYYIANDIRQRQKSLLFRKWTNPHKCKKFTSKRKKGLREYIQSKFKEGMTWENYGDWVLDHIKPLCLFDLTNDSELKLACHYTNLQPLWAEEHKIKTAKEQTERNLKIKVEKLA